MSKRLGHDLEDIPLVDDQKAHDALRQAVWDSAVRGGANARAAGLPLTACPPFKDGDMVASWRIGWRSADAKTKA